MEPKELKKHSTKLWISGFLKVKQAGNSLAERQYVKVLMKMTFRVNGQLKWLAVLLVTGLQNKWKLPVKNMQHISLYFSTQEFPNSKAKETQVSSMFVLAYWYLRAPSCILSQKVLHQEE